MITPLKIAIDRSGYKQQHIASQIGIDGSLLSRYVRGDRPTPIDVLRKICKILKVKLSDVQ